MVKVLVGFGAIVLGVLLIIITAPSDPAAASTPNPISWIDPLLVLGGLVLVVWGCVEAIRSRRRLSGTALLIAGIVLGVLLVAGFPALWRFAEGGMVNFIPAPILVPLLAVIPGLLIYKGIQDMRR